MVRNKAIVGINAFAHEAGIHQHGMIDDARTYEIMRPQDVGVSAHQTGAGQTFGPPRHREACAVAGLLAGQGQMTQVFAAFKRRADDIGEIDDDEMRALFTHGRRDETGWRLSRLEARVETTHEGRAVVELDLARGDAEPVRSVAIGRTALEAAVVAVRQITGADAELEEAEIMQTGFGAHVDAMAETMVRVDGATYRGRGRGPDPLWAGVRSVLDAVNKANRVVGRRAGPNPYASRESEGAL